MVETRNTRRPDASTDEAEANSARQLASVPMPAEGQNQDLNTQVKELRDVISQQAEVIEQLQAIVATNRSTVHVPSSSIKAPPVTCYSGKSSERTSEKVRSFSYSVQKAGTLHRYSDEQMLAFAEYYLQDRAASWIMRLEREGNKPTTLESLKKAIIAEFVPANEKAKARVRLMDIKSSQSEDLEDHIANFEDLISLCDTPVNEAYIYFFNSLPSPCKAKFAEKFLSSQPLRPDGEPSIHVAYEYARTLYLSYKLSKSTKDGNSEQDANGHKKKRQAHDKEPQRSDNGKKGSRTTKEWKDDSVVCWGLAQSGEGGIYRKYDRCCVCGLKGWNEPSHPCRKDNKGSKGSKESDSKN